MDKYLERYNLPRLKKLKIWTDQFQVLKLKCPTNKNQGPNGFTGKFYQTSKEELTPIHLKLSQKLQKKEHFQAHSMRPPSTWYQNQRYHKKIIIGQHHWWTQTQKVLNKILVNQTQQYIKRNIQPWSSGFTPGMQIFFNSFKSMWYSTLTNWRKTIGSSQ